MYKDDPSIAARFIRIAAENGNGPVYLRNLAASLLSESNQLEVALQFLTEELANLPAGGARDIAMVKVYEVRYEIAQRDANAAIAAYREATGALPAKPTDVIEAGYPLPEDPISSVDYLASLSISPAPAVGWIWDPDPEAPPGTVVSAGFEDVFLQISKATGYGSRWLREDLGH